MRLPRPMIMLALVALILAACGGGSNEAATTVAADSSVDDSGSSQGGASGDNADSISYTISGSYEASGVQSFVSAMSFFNNGVWTMTFGDLDDGGTTLLILNLDPSTPSVNFTDGKFTVSGDTSSCDFNIARQDANGASGSFECSGAPGVDTGSGSLSQDNDFSGTFDATS